MPQSNFGNPEAFKKLVNEIIDEAYNKNCQKFKLVITIEADATEPDVAKVDFVLEETRIAE